jgi:hypothetical protein
MRQTPTGLQCHCSSFTAHELEDVGNRAHRMGVAVS